MIVSSFSSEQVRSQQRGREGLPPRRPDQALNECAGWTLRGRWSGWIFSRINLDSAMVGTMVGTIAASSLRAAPPPE
jgi:hypothetical protein